MRSLETCRFFGTNKHIRVVDSNKYMGVVGIYVFRTLTKRRFTVSEDDKL